MANTIYHIPRYLGRLCDMNHDYKQDGKSTGKSLRDSKYHQCVFCCRERGKKWRDENKPKVKSLQKRWRRNRTDAQKKKIKKYHQVYYKTVTMAKRQKVQDDIARKNGWDISGKVEGVV